MGILLNIIFGIIIDTFSELREAKNAKLVDTREKCFICGINKAVFDTEGPGLFERHIDTEHNMWDHLCFMVFIWLQDRDDDDGLEQYMNSCLERGDITWFPTNKAMSLTQEEQSEEIIQKGVAELKTICSKTQQDSMLRYNALSVKMTEELARMKEQIDELPAMLIETQARSELVEAQGLSLSQRRATTRKAPSRAGSLTDTR